MKKRDVINLILLAMVLIAGYILHINKTYTHERTAFKLDTVVEIKVISKLKNIDTLLDSVFTMIDEYEMLLSFHKENSQLQTINLSEEENFSIPTQYYEILQVSEQVYLNSDSLFDISIGTLTEIWDFDNEIIPEEKEIHEAERYIGFNKITYSETEMYKPYGMKLNFGGIAKGYIIDKVTDFLNRESLISGIINIGGDIRLFGQEKPLKVGIQHPRGERNEITGILKVKNEAIVTSGDYERFFISAGKRYHHIIDPLTGYPALKNVSVTVIAETAVIADAYSTAIFMMEREKAIQLANSIEGMEVLVLYLENDELKKLGSNNIDLYLEDQE